ncbi:MAG TPA: hypothetical protein VGU71_04740 [Candidatus Dormibacteraeota bacterium]|nr:hypothetical protein [Candidatus Dormibacteraeota bacterium]
MSSSRGRRTGASAGGRRRPEADGGILTTELVLVVLDPHVGETPVRSIDVDARRLRRKLHDDPRRPRYAAAVAAPATSSRPAPD